MLLLTLPLAFAPLTDWHVDVQGTAPGSGTLADPYTSIEYAIAQPTTVPGDRILVAPGTYTGETIDFLGKELSIEAAQGPGTVTVQGPYTPSTGAHTPGSGGQALIRVVHDEGPGTRIEGINFENGAGEDTGTEVVGGVLFMNLAQLELVDCHLSGYARTAGGAVHCTDSSLTVSGGSLQGVVTHPEGTSSNGSGTFHAEGGSLWAHGSAVAIQNSSIEGQIQFQQSQGSQTTVFSSLLKLESCTTVLHSTALIEFSPCQLLCIKGSNISVLGGSLSVLACTWGGVYGAASALSAANANLHLQDLTWSGLGMRLHGARLLAGSNCTTTIQGCHFFDSPGAQTDLSPYEHFPGGLISHAGHLEVTGTTFSNIKHVQGAAISADHAVIRACTFQNNVAQAGWITTSSQGGAIRLGTGTIEDCLFLNNSAQSPAAMLGVSSAGNPRGGAIYVTGLTTIRRCEFIGNRCEVGSFWATHDYRGGAIYAEAPIRILECTFRDNSTSTGGSTAVDRFADMLGGAVYLDQGGAVEGCTFENNVSSSPWEFYANQTQGGAIYSANGTLLINDTEFLSNEAEQGGALYLGPGAWATMTQCLFQGNSVAEYVHTANAANGAAWFGSAAATRCTLTGHDLLATGAELFPSGTLDSCIVWGNQPLGLPAGAQATYSTVEGMAPGLGNSDEDPLFWAKDDLHLLPASPAIDAGNPALFDDDGSRADRGAYAFDPAYCGTLCAQPLGSHPCDSNPNSSGATATIAAFGSADVSDQFLSLSATQVPENSIGYFLTGQFGGFVPLFNGSAGNLCLGGQIYRMHDTLQTANAGNRIGRRVDMMDLAYGNVILPGSTWHFQFWFRDHGSMTPATKTSGSVQIQF